MSGSNNNADLALGNRYNLSGTNDPSIVPTSAAQGSIYLKLTAPFGVYQKQDDGLTTNWILIGSGGGGLEFENVIYADSANPNAGDGSSGNPFKSLQDAIDLADTMGSVLREKMRILILIGANSAFDEDIIIPAARHIQLLGLGPWILGDGAGVNFASTTPRNVTYYTDQNVELSNARPVLVIGTLLSGQSVSTHIGYTNGVIISGNITLMPPIGGDPNTTVELNLHNTDVIGTIDGVAHTGILQAYLFNSRLRNIINDPSMRIQRAVNCLFGGATVTIAGYSQMSQCSFSAATWNVSSTISDVPPIGIISSQFAGVTWNGPGNLRVDAMSNYYFKTGGNSLMGGAKVILGDVTP